MRRKGMGKGMGQGYKNILSVYDSHIHSLSAKGVRTLNASVIEFSVKRGRREIKGKEKEEYYFKTYGREGGLKKIEIDKIIATGNYVLLSASNLSGDMGLKVVLGGKKVEEQFEYYTSNDMIYNLATYYFDRLRWRVYGKKVAKAMDVPYLEAFYKIGDMSKSSEFKIIHN